MSHIPQRKETDCLNCGTIVQGSYCHVCGQENVVPKETFWHMVTHFFYDITHFDSSFFHTIHHLLFKPGFLSKEYTSGRRASYLHPIRMYVFTSAIFFLLFFSFFKRNTKIQDNTDKPITAQLRSKSIQILEEQLEKDSGNIIIRQNLTWLRDTTQAIKLIDLIVREIDQPVFDFGGRNYRSQEDYDSLQRILPKNERDGWLERRVVSRVIEINRKARQNPTEALKKFLESTLHRLPFMLFISLPLFALILKLVYVRRKQFYFSDHGIFTIHLYVFSFLLLLVVFGLDKLQDITGSAIWSWLMVLLFPLLFFYLYKAMRNYYGQRRLKTFIKFIMVALLSLIMILVLFVLFMIFSAATF